MKAGRHGFISVCVCVYVLGWAVDKQRREVMIAKNRRNFEMNL